MLKKYTQVHFNSWSILHTYKVNKQTFTHIRTLKDTHVHKCTIAFHSLRGVSNSKNRFVNSEY